MLETLVIECMVKGYDYSFYMDGIIPMKDDVVISPDKSKYKILNRQIVARGKNKITSNCDRMTSMFIRCEVERI